MLKFKKVRLIKAFAIFSSVLFMNLFVIADDIDSQRGMTNLLGIETYQRCSKQMSNPEAKIYELSYERTSSLSLIHI